MKLLLSLLACLYLVGCRGQTWPTKDCVDRPYTKGADGIIYHTGSCSPVAFFQIDDTSLFLPLYIGKKIKIHPKKHEIILAGGWKCRTDYTDFNGKIVKTVYHPDSLFCPMCGKIVPKEHVIVRIEKGYLANELTKDHQFVITKLGLYVKNKNNYINN
jgi:hypothetical protein